MSWFSRSQICLLRFGAVPILTAALFLPTYAQGTGGGTGGTGGTTAPMPGFGSGAGVTPGTGGPGATFGPVFCGNPTAAIGTPSGTGTPLPGTSGPGNLQCGQTGATPFAQGFSFTAEGMVPLSFVLAQTQPQLDSTLFNAVSSGNSEIRERVTYPSSDNVMTVEFFSVPSGTALPFPMTPIAAPGTVFSRINVLVQSFIFTDGSTPSLLVAGTVVSNQLGGTVFGNLAGRAVAVSLGITPPFTLPGMGSLIPGAAGTSTTPPSGNAGGTTTFGPSQTAGTMLEVMIAGGFVTASPTASVTVQFGPGAPGGSGGGGGGGTTGQAPVISIAPVTPTPLKQIMLDASATTNPAGSGPLTYSWTSLGNQASITNGNTATPNVQFDVGPRDYVFQVVVTNPQGFSSVGTITIRYVGR